MHSSRYTASAQGIWKELEVWWAWGGRGEEEGRENLGGAAVWSL